jgi:hypothetical protein
MVQRARRGADYVVLVEERAGFLRELPVWMCDAAACAAMTFGPPAVSIGALQALSAILMDRSANHRSGASSGSPVTEDLAGEKSDDSSPDPTRAEACGRTTAAADRGGRDVAPASLGRPSA